MRSSLCIVAAYGMLACGTTMPAAARGEKVALHLEADSGVRLERFERHVPGRRGGADHYAPICVAPCDIVVHDWTEFHVSVDGVGAGSSFFLRPGPPVVVRVHRGHPWMTGAGTIAAFFGVPLGAGAGAFAAAVPVTRPATTAISLTSLGAAALGIALYFVGRTTLDASPASSLVQ